MTRPIFELSAVLLLALCAAACDRPAPATEGGADGRDRAAAEDGAGDAYELSDLDRPVAELMSARCEHDMPTHRCAECRYEVGVVHADDSLFDPERGGVLEAVELAAGPARRELTVPAEVALDGNRTVAVTPLAEGVVTAVRVDLGEAVRRGELLLELESPAYREAVADLVRARSAEDEAAATVAREEELFRRRVCPEKDLLAARAGLAAARAQRQAAEAGLLALGIDRAAIERVHSGGDPGLLALRSPIDGVVLERAVSRGSRVAPGERLMLVADLSELWVMAELYEQDLAAVLTAEAPVTAEVEVAAWPGRRFRGQVERIAGTLDPATRTARARVVVDNRDGLLRAGMFAQVHLALPAPGAAIMVPREAVLEDDGRSFAFVHVDGPYWVRRPVRIGTSRGEQLEVIAGLTAGDRVVTTGAFLLKSDVLRSKMGAGCAD